MTQNVEMPRIANATTEPEEHGEIEITEEMIESGADFLLCHPIFDSSEEEYKLIARDVFVAMIGARRK
jgi:hypothetical protein